MLLKIGNCTIEMFLTGFNVYFVFGYAYFAVCVCLKTATWVFLGQGLAFL